MSSTEPSFQTLPAALQSAVLALLSPHQLARCACVSKEWRALVVQATWAQFYSQLWEPDAGAAAAAAAPVTAPAADWQRLYGQRQLLARCWLGRPASDKLTGHTGQAVKACRLLAPQGLLFTGGVDRTVRAWDLQSGFLLGTSRRHGGTVRCLAADCNLLASGSTDNAIRLWQRSGGGGRLPFELEGERAVLAGHTGPVSALQLTPQLLVSGSWDCTLRLWDRTTWECVGLVHTDDWVSALALRGELLAAVCGPAVLLFRLEDGGLHRLASLSCPSVGGVGDEAAARVTAVECSADGGSLFLGTADGGVWLADVRGWPEGGAAERQLRPQLLQQQADEVAGLSWDHPWLAVADRAGNVVLLDAGACTAAGAAAIEGSAAKPGKRGRRALPSRLLFSASQGGAGTAAQCVALAGSWAAAGLDCGTVVSFDGSRGQQQLAAAAAARQQKAEQRERNKQRNRAGKASGSSQRSQPLPIHRPAPAASAAEGSSAAHGQQQQQQQPQGNPGLGQSPGGRVGSLGRSPSSRARVPPPLHPDVLAAAAAAAAAGGCRQQAWQVLRHARSAPDVRGGGRAGAPPQP